MFENMSIEDSQLVHVQADAALTCGFMESNDGDFAALLPASGGSPVREDCVGESAAEPPFGDACTFSDTLAKTLDHAHEAAVPTTSSDASG